MKSSANSMQSDVGFDNWIVELEDDEVGDSLVAYCFLHYFPFIKTDIYMQCSMLRQATY